jgi:hypothetical protein
MASRMAVIHFRIEGTNAIAAAVTIDSEVPAVAPMTRD